ncbi:MAG: hypothetical protein A4S12_08010 [Proteobacteria bacterium SG_bin5]|nr:hypothetical protein [Sphingomonas sp.]OQW41519.1 MAG: hypothetical protein A4S12_08010 [Proteobacteria bacterium SG_bin5]
MDPFFYVMAIMGCGDDGSACAELRVEPARFASIAACQAAMPGALQRNVALDYPVISATCRETGVRMADAEPRRMRRTERRGG